MYGMTPFGRNALDFFDFLNDSERASNAVPVNSCRTDIIDEGDKYVMESELPGFNKEDIKLNINDDRLTITAKHSENKEAKDDSNKYIRRERTFGSYHRSFDITDIQTDEISAEYKNGILIIDLPKRRPAEPVTRTLEIK